MNEEIQNKLFWSPSVCWNIENNQLHIEIFVYGKQFAGLFPKFYFVTQKGISEEKLMKFFPDINMDQFKMFVRDLKKKRILVDSILDPAQVFFPQTRLLEHPYGESLLIDADKLKEFKNKQYNREYYTGASRIELPSNRELPAFILNRRSYRDFDQTKIFKYDDFSVLASVYRQVTENGTTRYLYASAGGLYPIDVYYYIKNNRVENIKGGLYYYDPRRNCLTVVNEMPEIPRNVHYYSNQDIFSKSAYSIYYFYNGEVSMPKYGGMGYFNSIIDLGIMVATYSALAQEIGAGLCSIGEMNFQLIKPQFKLQKNQVYLHTVEVGLK